jgi:AraC-like DNA-binding protein
MPALTDAPPITAVVDLHHGIRCTTDDFDVFHEALNNAFYPARQEIIGGGAKLQNAQMSAVRLTGMTVGIVRYGADIRIDPGDVGGYHIDLPIAGSMDTNCGTQQLVATSGVAAVYSPGEHTFISRWGADTTQVCIKIDRAVLEQELALMLDRPVHRRVKFDLGFDVTSPRGQRWCALLRLLLDTVAGTGPLPDAAAATQIFYLERALIVGLLADHVHSMSQAVHADVKRADNPVPVRKVLELVAAEPGAQYTITDLAAAAGVGSRRLQQLFQTHVGMRPSDYLRNVRLDGARRDLLAEGTASSVSDVAFRWGFNHLGRFSRYYDQKFGEMPSRTCGLRR